MEEVASMTPELIGYESVDLEKGLMDKFFENWQAFNTMIDSTNHPLHVRDRVQLYHTYLTGWRGKPSSENIIV